MATTISATQYNAIVRWSLDYMVSGVFPRYPKSFSHKTCAILSGSIRTTLREFRSAHLGRWVGRAEIAILLARGGIEPNPGPPLRRRTYQRRRSILDVLAHHAPRPRPPQAHAIPDAVLHAAFQWVAPPPVDPPAEEEEEEVEEPAPEQAGGVDEVFVDMDDIRPLSPGPSDDHPDEPLVGIEPNPGPRALFFLCLILMQAAITQQPPPSERYDSCDMVCHAITQGFLRSVPKRHEVLTLLLQAGVEPNPGPCKRLEQRKRAAERRAAAQRAAAAGSSSTPEWSAEDDRRLDWILEELGEQLKTTRQGLADTFEMMGVSTRAVVDRLWIPLHSGKNYNKADLGKEFGILPSEEPVANPKREAVEPAPAIQEAEPAPQKDAGAPVPAPVEVLAPPRLPESVPVHMYTSAAIEELRGFRAPPPLVAATPRPKRQSEVGKAVEDRRRKLETKRHSPEGRPTIDVEDGPMDGVHVSDLLKLHADPICEEKLQRTRPNYVRGSVRVKYADHPAVYAGNSDVRMSSYRHVTKFPLGVVLSTLTRSMSYLVSIGGGEVVRRNLWTVEGRYLRKACWMFGSLAFVTLQVWMWVHFCADWDRRYTVWTNPGNYASLYALPGDIVARCDPPFLMGGKQCVERMSWTMDILIAKRIQLGCFTAFTCFLTFLYCEQKTVEVFVPCHTPVDMEGEETVGIYCPALLSSLLAECRWDAQVLEASGPQTVLRLASPFNIPATLAPQVLSATLHVALLVARSEQSFTARLAPSGGVHSG